MKIDILEALKAQGFSPRTVLDVGAHVGSFAQQFLNVFPDCVPTLIEPNPFCQKALAEIGFELYGVAASREAGRAELYLTKEWLQSTGSSLYRENTHFFRDDVVVKHEVDKVRLDDLFQGRRFDFVKIDTQGSELDVLRGGQTVLSQADYILVEISLVEYNIGGARAEAVFAQLNDMGFHCTEVTEFHRLSGVQNGNLLQMDILFERRRAVQSLPVGVASLAGLQSLAQCLSGEGRAQEALLLLQHLESLQGGNAGILRQLVSALGSAGRTLEAIEKLSALKAVTANTSDLVDDIRRQLPAAFERFNELVKAGDVGAAEKYASALADLVPGNTALLNSALSCNVALGRKEMAAKYATALLRFEPTHAAAQAALGELKAPVPSPHPLLQLRDLHDEASLILCRELDAQSSRQVEQLVAAARALRVDVPPGSDWEGWLKHYRVAIDAIDVPAILAPTPAPMKEPRVSLATATGREIDWKELKATAKRLGARTVFFAAADRKYVDLYARWYVSSILKFCDVNCVVVVHVIGGGAELKAVAKSLGIKDERLIFAGDAFSAEAVTTKCFDTPPKGLIALPVAHFQSARFLRVGNLLQKLKLPVFVSDIDLLLQRGVEDLLERCAGTDVVFNENGGNTNAGSRLTANLLLVQPTENAAIFLRFLRSYLERALSGGEVTRWIDQFGLLMARHHLMHHVKQARLAYFDTNSDINNVMYKSYQDHPFRFLSLYHGFDTSSLEPVTKAVKLVVRRALKPGSSRKAAAHARRA